MPFPPQTPQPFTRAVVEHLRPGAVGCFGLKRGEQWVYVGKGEIRERLLDLLERANGCIATHKPTHFVTVLCDPADSLERELVEELMPVCNERAA